MPHPHGDTCRCPPLPTDAGLLAHTISCDHHAQLTRALAAIAAIAAREPRTATLHVLTTDHAPDNLVPLHKPCDGSMTCECVTCAQDRADRVRTGGREPAQPWHARPAARPARQAA